MCVTTVGLQLYRAHNQFHTGAHKIGPYLRTPHVTGATCFQDFHSEPQRMELLQGFILAIFLFITLFNKGRCILFPRESESRELKDISGLWNFRADNSSNRNLGFEKEWWQKPLRQVVKAKFT